MQASGPEVHGTLLLLLATPCLLPVPGAGTALGPGLVFRDGVAVILGLLMSGVALAATIGLLLKAGVWGGEWILGWI